MFFCSCLLVYSWGRPVAICEIRGDSFGVQWPLFWSLKFSLLTDSLSLLQTCYTNSKSKHIWSGFGRKSLVIWITLVACYRKFYYRALTFCSYRYAQRSLLFYSCRLCLTFLHENSPHEAKKQTVVSKVLIFVQIWLSFAKPINLSPLLLNFLARKCLFKFLNWREKFPTMRKLYRYN